MKNFLGALAFAIAFIFTQGAAAVPSLGQIVGDPALNGVLDDGSVAFAITDTDGVDDDISTLLTLELAGFANSNSAFIYDLNNPLNRLGVFDGPDAPFDSTILTYTGAGAWNNGSPGGDAIFGSDFAFGMGLVTPNGIFFSDPTLNPGGVDHLLTFQTEGVSGLYGAFEMTFAWEDIAGGGDLDYNDMVYAGTDIEPFAVPTPAPMALFGLGLVMLGLGWQKRAARKA